MSSHNVVKGPAGPSQGRGTWAVGIEGLQKPFIQRQALEFSSWRENSLSGLHFRGSCVPMEVSLSFIQFGFTAGLVFSLLWCEQENNKNNLHVKSAPF